MYIKHSLTDPHSSTNGRITVKMLKVSSPEWAPKVESPDVNIGIYPIQGLLNRSNGAIRAHLDGNVVYCAEISRIQPGFGHFSVERVLLFLLSV